jgi:hypothetical protein
VGKLQGTLDEISIGDLDDEARNAAKVRRKAGAYTRPLFSST